MSEIHQTMRPNPSDYGIDGGGPKINQALADLVEMGLVVDSGQISERHRARPKRLALGPCAGFLLERASLITYSLGRTGWCCLKAAWKSDALF